MTQNPDNPEPEYEVRFSKSEACDRGDDPCVIQRGYSRRDALERARREIREDGTDPSEYPYSNIIPSGESFVAERFSPKDQHRAIGALLLNDVSFEEAARMAGLSEEVLQDMMERAGIEIEDDE